MKRPLRLSPRCAVDEINMLAKLLCVALPAGSGEERSAWGISHFPVHFVWNMEAITAPCIHLINGLIKARWKCRFKKNNNCGAHVSNGWLRYLNCTFVWGGKKSVGHRRGKCHAKDKDLQRFKDSKRPEAPIFSVVCQLIGNENSCLSSWLGTICLRQIHVL